jgi:hypothetical protein
MPDCQYVFPLRPILLTGWPDIFVEKIAHLVHFTAIWFFCGHFGIFCSYLVYSHSFGILCQEKSGNHAWFRRVRFSQIRVAATSRTTCPSF